MKVEFAYPLHRNRRWAYCTIQIVIITQYRFSVQNTIGAKKSICFCTVIPTSQIIQPGFFVEYIPTIAEGIEFAESVGQRSGGGEGFTPGVVGVGYDFGTGAVDEGDDIALEVMEVGEFLGFGTIVPFQEGGLAGSIVEEMEGVLAVGQVNDIFAMEGVAGGVADLVVGDVAAVKL